MGERIALIDLNMGCPVPKVTRKGEGAALMRDPELAARIVSAVVSAVDIPVTAKFRSGWDSGDRSAPGFARTLEEEGLSALCVHGRSATQGYSGASDPTIIAETVAAVSIPVLASGDLFSRDAITETLRRTGAAGALIARGACGNPWIFSHHEPDSHERLMMALRHTRGLCELDPRMGLHRMRRHMAYYLTGFPHAAGAREAAMRCQTYDEFEALCGDIDERLSSTDGKAEEERHG